MEHERWRVGVPIAIVRGAVIHTAHAGKSVRATGRICLHVIKHGNLRDSILQSTEVSSWGSVIEHVSDLYLPEGRF